MEVRELYTPIEEARSDIYQRWADYKLRTEVEAFIGSSFPGKGPEPYAVLCRTLATPNRETVRFVELAAAVGLTPIAQEYVDDRFCALNPDKLNLVRMTFLNGKDRQGRPIFRRKMVAENGHQGGAFKTIKTSWGENLVAFHHRLFQQFLPNINYSNESEWYRNNGATPKLFYVPLLCRFICHGILFENFLESRNEWAFTRDVVMPAFEVARSLFGVKPIIVRLIPDDTADDPSWGWYTEEIENYVNQHLTFSGRTHRPVIVTSDK